MLVVACIHSGLIVVLFHSFSIQRLERHIVPSQRSVEVRLKYIMSKSILVQPVYSVAWFVIETVGCGWILYSKGVYIKHLYTSKHFYNQDAHKWGHLSGTHLERS